MPYSERCICDSICDPPNIYIHAGLKSMVIVWPVLDIREVETVPAARRVEEIDKPLAALNLISKKAGISTI